MKLKGQVVEIMVPGRLLRGNPLGDPAERAVPVYLPPVGRGDRSLPVVYTLAGFTGSGRSFLNYNAFEPALPERVDRLIAKGKLRPCILVFPDCMTKYGGSQYINSSAMGPYEDYLVRDLVPAVEQALGKKLSRGAAPGKRGLIGKSSGGYGALVLGMRHSKVFCAAASISGDAYFEYCYKRDFPKALDGLTRWGGLGAFLRKGLAADPKPGDFHDTLNIVAMAAAYSPNPRAPHGFDLPFDEKTGELREGAWKRWLKHDPVHLAGRYAAQLRKLAFLHIEAGARDEFALHLGARILSRRLKALAVPHSYEEFDGGHFNISHRYERVLPRMVDALSRA